MIVGYAKGQKLEIAHPVIADGTDRYLIAEFVFQTADWDKMTKIAHFRQGENKFDIELTEDKTKKSDRLNLTNGEWEVYLHGEKDGERITTTIGTIKVERTGELSPPSPAVVLEDLTIFPSEEEIVHNHPDSDGYDIITQKPMILENKTVEPTTENIMYLPEGNGFKSFTVEAVTADIDSNIQPENIKKDVEILGVTGTLESEEPELEDLTIIPSTSQIVYNHPQSDGYDIVIAEGVTSSIDANIQAGNIKKDVSILGVTGTYEGESPAIQPLKTVTLTDVEQEITADSGYTVMAKVDVKIAFTDGGRPTVVESGNLVLPDNVTFIKSQAFSESGLNSISGNGVVEIRTSSFNAARITVADFPNLEYINGSAFYSCGQLQTLIFSDTLTRVTGIIASFCNNLKTIHLPASIESGTTSIRFEYCGGMENFTVGQGFKRSLNISDSNRFSQATLEAIIDNLADLTGQTSQTLTMGATNLAKLSQTYLDMMTNKNWAYA